MVCCEGGPGGRGGGVHVQVFRDVVCDVWRTDDLLGDGFVYPSQIAAQLAQSREETTPPSPHDLLFARANLNRRHLPYYWDLINTSTRGSDLLILINPSISPLA